MNSTRFDTLRIDAGRRGGGFVPGGSRIGAGSGKYNSYRFNGRNRGLRIGPPSTVRLAVNTRLRSLAAVSALVDARVYPDPPPQSWIQSAGPCVTYELTTEDREVDLDGVAAVAVAEFDLRAYGLSLASAEQAFLSIVSGFPSRGDVIAGLVVDSILPAGETESYDFILAGSSLVVYVISQSFHVAYQTGA